MAPILAAELGRIIFGMVSAEMLRGALQRSGETGIAGESTSKERCNQMSRYDLVGFRDEDYGSIGAQLIGLEDDELLEALSVEGLGDEIISGLGDSEIIGAVKAAQQQAMLAKIRSRNDGAVVNRGLDRRRRYPLGFIPTEILTGATAAVPSAPQNLFRPERLVVPSDIAFDLGVADIKVGNQSQFVQSAEVPAALFSEVAINTGVTFDTAEVGNQVSVNMRNKSLATVEFSAGLVGTIAK